MKNFLCTLNFLYTLLAFIVVGFMLIPLMLAHILISFGGGRPSFDVTGIWHSCVFYFYKKYNLRIPSI